MAYYRLSYLFGAFAVVIVVLLLFQSITTTSARQECARMPVCGGYPVECPIQEICWEVPDPQPIWIKKKRYLRRRSLLIKKN
ncbi:unnamed protein product [Rotaria sp. Silwood2]|nr:unnamed protein product [Rotaria sp. Silwood2]CAF2817864.1 unnamed protein product [Rotaria sp. Silwood2]CAF3011066.1 unnamed protein product [Rotaria sp. Silwood2]CAF3975949.1 unnamed protein product [Rotaria sp. Silwood2]CAF4433076.1 unnamed protein product [Rotaria sp. Silwood2]